MYISLYNAYIFFFFFSSKQEVTFKPLGFWTQKVKDLDEKKPEKKKENLYDLSDSDESFTATRKCVMMGRGTMKSILGQNQETECGFMATCLFNKIQFDTGLILPSRKPCIL